MRAFGANGRGHTYPNVAGRADVPRKLGLRGGELRDLFHGRLINFFLGVEASAHSPFVKEVEKRARLNEPDGFGVGKKIKREFGGNAATEEFVFGGPRVDHGAIVNSAGARVAGDQHGRDVVGRVRVGKDKQRPRAGYHAVALVLAVSGVADFFGESVTGVLQGAHHRCMNADVENLQTIGIARGIQEAIDGFCVRTFSFRETDDGAVGFGDRSRRTRRIVEKDRGFAVETRIEFPREPCTGTVEAGGFAGRHRG